MMKIENNDMQKSNGSQNTNSDNPAWDILAEFSLSEYLSVQDNEVALVAGFLFQTLRELGLPIECVENIEMTLVGLVKEALMHFKQGRLIVPGRILVFCQKKSMDYTTSARSASRSYSKEQAMDHAQMLSAAGTKMEGGWGYFLIERGCGGSSTGSSGSSWNSVDLYLYKEGE